MFAAKDTAATVQMALRAAAFCFTFFLGWHLADVIGGLVVLGSWLLYWLGAWLIESGWIHFPGRRA